MGKSIDNITEESMEKLFEFIKSQGLSSEKAFAIIYYLQEKMEILPDHYELCSVCGDLYDSYSGGMFLDDDLVDEIWHEDEENPLPEQMNKYYCDTCKP